MKHRLLYILALLFATMQTFAQSTTKYEYDKNHRLTKVTYSNGMTISYTYDELGNRLSKKVTSGFLKGDANGDGKVDAADVVEIVNSILDNPSTGFNQDAADANGDGNVDISDAVGVVNIILNK